MYLVYCDETNLSPKDHEFFVFGSLLLGIDKAESLHDAIDAIRKGKGFASTDVFKFNTSSRPKHISIEDYTEAKKEVIQALIKAKAKILFSVTNHKISGSENKARRYAINIAMRNIDELLQQQKRRAIIYVDSFAVNKKDKINTDLREILTELFEKGLHYPSGYQPLKNIISFNVSYSGTSHLSSAADIAIGSFRYWLNCVGEEGDTLRKKNAIILESISPLFVGIKGTENTVAAQSLAMYPLKVSNTEAYERYLVIKDRFEQDSKLKLRFWVSKKS